MSKFWKRFLPLHSSDELNVDEYPALHRQNPLIRRTLSQCAFCPHLLTS